MGWIIESLLDIVNNALCELFNIVADSFGRYFQIDLDIFDKFFPLAKDMKTAFVFIGIALMLFFTILQLFKNFFGPLAEAESPASIVGRFFLTTLSIIFCFDIMIEVQKIFNEFYLLFLNIDTSSNVNDYASEISVSTDSVSSFFIDITTDVAELAISPIVATIVSVIFMFLILGGFLSLVFQLASKYITMCALFYTAPLAVSTLATQSTAPIFKSWVRMFASQCLLMILNVFFIKVFIAAIDIKPNGFGNVVDFIMWNFMILAWLGLGRTLEMQMSSLGISTAKGGRDIGASIAMGLGSMAIAGRYISASLSKLSKGRTIAAGMPGAGGIADEDSLLYTFSGGGLSKESASAVMNQKKAEDVTSINGEQALQTTSDFFGYTPTGTENVENCQFGAGYARISHLDGTQLEYYAAEGGNAASIPDDSMGQLVKGSDGNKYHVVASGNNSTIASAFGSSSLESYLNNTAKANNQYDKNNKCVKENYRWDKINDAHGNHTGAYLVSDFANKKTYQVTSSAMYNAPLGSQKKIIDGHSWNFTDITPNTASNPLPVNSKNASQNVSSFVSHLPTCSRIEGQNVVNASYSTSSNIWTAHLENGETRYVKQSNQYIKDSSSQVVQGASGREYFITKEVSSTTYQNNYDIRATKKHQNFNGEGITYKNTPKSSVGNLFNLKK